MAPVCVHCGQQAPIVYRGVVAYCTACGALRGPLTGPSINMAGRPSSVGGTFASVLGWLVLAIGSSIALGVALLFAALGWWQVGVAVGLPIALLAVVLGVLLVKSGRALSTSGEQKAQATRDQALMAMAAHRGAVTAYEAGRLLGIPTAEADALLTSLAKRDPDRVGMDVDDQGVVWYRVASAPGQPLPRMRVDTGGAPPGAVEAQGRESRRAISRPIEPAPEDDVVEGPRPAARAPR